MIETETEKEGLSKITVYAQPELGRITGYRDTGQRDRDIGQRDRDVIERETEKEKEGL